MSFALRVPAVVPAVAASAVPIQQADEAFALLRDGEALLRDNEALLRDLRSLADGGISQQGGSSASAAPAPSPVVFYLYLLLAGLLITLAGAYSGLTVGLLGMDEAQLQILLVQRERRRAAASRGQPATTMVRNVHWGQQQPHQQANADSPLPNHAHNRSHRSPSFRDHVSSSTASKFSDRGTILGKEQLRSFVSAKTQERLSFYLRNHHRLLCTLLIGNTICLESLPLVLEQITPDNSSALAVCLSILSVLLFGEILPMAFLTGDKRLDHVLKLEGLLHVSFFYLFAVVAVPMGALLDKVLGKRGRGGPREEEEELAGVLEMTDRLPAPRGGERGGARDDFGSVAQVEPPQLTDPYNLHPASAVTVQHSTEEVEVRWTDVQRASPGSAAAPGRTDSGDVRQTSRGRPTTAGSPARAGRRKRGDSALSKEDITGLISLNLGQEEAALFNRSVAIVSSRATLTIGDLLLADGEAGSAVGGPGEASEESEPGVVRAAAVAAFQEDEPAPASVEGVVESIFLQGRGRGPTETLDRSGESPAFVVITDSEQKRARHNTALDSLVLLEGGPDGSELTRGIAGGHAGARPSTQHQLFTQAYRADSGRKPVVGVLSAADLVAYRCGISSASSAEISNSLFTWGDFLSATTLQTAHLLYVDRNELACRVAVAARQELQRTDLGNQRRKQVVLVVVVERFADAARSTASSARGTAPTGTSDASETKERILGFVAAESLFACLHKAEEAAAAEAVETAGGTVKEDRTTSHSGENHAFADFVGAPNAIGQAVDAFSPPKRGIEQASLIGNRYN